MEVERHNELGSLTSAMWIDKCNMFATTSPPHSILSLFPLGFDLHSSIVDSPPRRCLALSSLTRTVVYDPRALALFSWR
ncbi:hypothetical protein L6164_004693 [Bauhinia variegata]|uniref:Uncharacterized protein n=1 Tax=Bauhinia variegata TaxID=167791 RepID=A0ACB9PNU4_BAUVA|nr:hypothetical protein L6164_004693 [Bauhinia variegata]